MCEIITCGAKPCENGGTCSDVNTHFVCSCMKGFKGVVCEVPFDACDWEPCQHGGSCTVDGQGLHCMCAPEYTGSVCSILKGMYHVVYSIYIGPDYGYLAMINVTIVLK